MGSPLLFILLAIVAIAAAMGMLLSRSAVHSALFLVLNFATIAVFYIILNAPFIAMVQITVYAGAIMVLFLFVIMLLGAEQLPGVRSGETWQRYLAALLAVALVSAFGLMLYQGEAMAAANSGVIDTSPQALGLRLFEAYVFPFELTGVLLLTAMIGVVVLSKGKAKK
jgi:NADH-quinone oxidoreductase subunit J